jgi:chromosome segregation ATPase
MSGSLNQSSQNNIVSSRTICTIELTALVAAKLTGDESTRNEVTELINQAYQLQSACAALSEKRKTETLTSLEERHVDLLMEHSELNKQFEALKNRQYEFDGEAGRVNGRARHAQVELETHRSSKKNWVEMLVLPAHRQEFAAKEQQLIDKLESVRNEQGELKGLIAAWQEDVSAMAYKLRCKLADVEVVWNKLQKMRGKAAGNDRATGLSL